MRTRLILTLVATAFISACAAYSAVKPGKVEVGSLGRARQTLGLKQGIDQETAKKISKDIRDQGFKKVQVSIQGEELRVTSPSRDTLQEVIAFVKSRDYGVELTFGSYR